MIKIISRISCIFLFLMLSDVSQAQNRTAFVHLFEWSWNDVAAECEQHLGPKGFAAVQVSPPQKSIGGSQWWTRYQPVSYAIEGRGGSREQFRSMVSRCAAVGVDIYVDAVINHMAAHDRFFPEVPYFQEHFHSCTSNINYQDRWQIQNCDLVGLNDLKTEDNYVRQKIADYMNDMISLGVKGFRIDAAKHIPAGDIANIISRLNQNVYIFQEVIGAPGEPVQPPEYVGNGDVTEFNFERTLAHYFKGRGPLRELRGIGTWDGWLASSDAVVFVSNHDDQRQNANNTLTFKDVGDLYYIGEIFQLAYPYGYPKVMSSYYFDDHDQGPPSRGPHTGDACGSGWVCEHRWRGIANMVGFRNATVDQWRVTHWWDNGNNQIAFGRGGLGFVVINREDGNDLNRTLQTGMAEGQYCDIINGEFNTANGTCSGPVINVGSDGNANFSVSSINASAIHVGARVGDTCTGGCCDSDCCEGDCGGPTWQNAYFRGTPNGWGTTAMTFSDGLWRTTQTFASSGTPRFKISRFTNWSEAYPAQDFAITEGAGTYDITFDDKSFAISVEKKDNQQGGSVPVTFTCHNGTTYMGQSVYVVGNIAELGNWNPASAVLLGTNTDGVSYPTWRKTLSLPSETNIEWKCLKRDENNPDAGIQWQGGGNNSANTGSGVSVSGGF